MTESSAELNRWETEPLEVEVVFDGSRIMDYQPSVKNNLFYQELASQIPHSELRTAIETDTQSTYTDTPEVPNPYMYRALSGSTNWFTLRHPDIKKWKPALETIHTYGTDNPEMASDLTQYNAHIDLKKLVPGPNQYWDGINAAILLTYKRPEINNEFDPQTALVGCVIIHWKKPSIGLIYPSTVLNDFWGFGYKHTPPKQKIYK